MKKLLYCLVVFFLLSGSQQVISAQLPSQVDIALVQISPDTLGIQLTSVGADFSEVISGLVVTIKWRTASGLSPGTLDLIGLENLCPLTTIPLSLNPLGVVQSGNYSYVNYTLVGVVQMQSCPFINGFGMQDGVPLTIGRIPIIGTGACGEFEITDDVFATQNNLEYFCSLNGQNKTGAIAASLASVVFDSCDDGNPNTYFDYLDDNCNCVGIAVDCNGFANGTAVPGSSCDDGNLFTTSDAYDVNCNCVGVAVDCNGIAGGSALPGSLCDDGNPGTVNDIWQNDCSCFGTPADCQGVPNGPAAPGTLCDDGDPLTVGEFWDASCNCGGGTVVDCDGVQGGTALPGTACNDNDVLTQNDTYDANCNCVGVFVDCEGVVNGTALPGTPCDDGAVFTANDMWDAYCTCSGVLADCEGVINGTANIGTPCDDGDPSTVNDTWSLACTCIGQTLDCEGVLSGPAIPGSACDDNDPLTGNDIWQTDCTCAGEFYDCNGVPGGPVIPGASCNDGNILTQQDTINANCDCVGIAVDCQGVLNGTALPGTACDDGNPSTNDEVWDALCNCAAATNTICFQLNNGPRKPADIEESETGNVYGDAGAFDLVYDSESPWYFRGNQISGLHFPAVTIPPNSSIVDAYIQFTAFDTVDFGPVNLNITAQLSSNAPKFDYDQYELSSRPRTANQITWAPPAWNVKDESGLPQRTPNIALLVQDIVNLQAWNGGNMAFFFEGTGGRQAYSSELDASKAAVLCITYSSVSLAPDCQGIQGGPNNQGSPCDDGNPNTGNDSWDTNCLCVGEPLDCTGAPAGTAFPGTGCDDGNASTGNDVYQSDCTCLGQLIDCNGITGGLELPGTSCDDGNPLTNFDQYDVSCNCAGTANSFYECVSLASGQALNPAVEEATNGDVYNNAGALDLVFDSELPWNWRGNQKTAMRFENVQVPQGASILNAFIQFSAAGIVNYDPIQLSISAEAADNALPLNSNQNNVSSRQLGSSQVGWSPPQWNVIGAAGMDQRTPDLSIVVQEIVSRQGWNQTNDLVFVISGYGGRQAFSTNAGPMGAPSLCITYTTDTLDFDCLGAAGGSALPGTPCDDGNSNTVNDSYDINCLCVGTPLDCVGLANGTSLPGTACDDGNPATGNDVYTADCNCTGLIIDCAGVAGGSAMLDACGVCNGNNDCLSGLDCIALDAVNDGDKEEAENGGVYGSAGSLDLVLDGELPYHWRGNQVVGLRFSGVGIPSGAIVTSAVIQFTAFDTINYNPCAMNIAVENEDDAAILGWGFNDISQRSVTSAVSWSPNPWLQKEEVGLNQRTPELANLVQQVINRPGWVSGNAMVFVIKGSGGRQAYSSEQDANKAAKLCLSWEMPSASNQFTNRSIEALKLNASLFPNPNRGDVVNMSIANKLEETTTATLVISDMYGKQLYTKAAIVNPGQHVEVIELNGALAKGVYFVNIELNSEIVTERLVIN